MIRTTHPALSLVFGTVIVLATLLSFPRQADAHPPKDIQLNYDAVSKTLKVTVTHPSYMPTMHYIKIVGIKKNGVEVSYNYYKYQPDKNTFTYTYTIAAENGDTFHVTAICNLRGDKTVTLKVVTPLEKTGK